MRKMKDSGIEWCGLIPNDWDVMPNKYIMEKKKEICVHYNSENILSLTMEGVIIRDLDAGGKMPTSFDGYQIVHKNNLLMCLFDYDVTPRCIGLINDDGITSPAYSQFVLKNNNYEKYYYYYYLMLDNTKELLHLAKNLRHSFTEEQLGSIHTPVPPIEEQKKIAYFLEKEISKIDVIIRKTKQTIENYKKYKQSIIIELVTKGVNKRNVLKNSGIKWIGDIPENWRVEKIKYHLKRNDIRNPGNMSVLSVYRDYGVIPKDSRDDNHNVTSEDVSKYKYVKKGDLVINKMKAWQGSLAVSDYEGIVSPAYFIYNFTDDVFNKKYFHYLVRSCYKDEFRRISGGIREGQWDLPPESFERTLIIIPPKEEQCEIVEYLEDKCTKIDKLIRIKEKSIQHLDEYKKSLIYEYVTGKKEVISDNIVEGNSKQIKINCRDNIFAQAILLCRIIEKLNQYNLGRVKAEKTLYLIEKEIGFDFDNNYVREAAGPLSESIYKCESVISKKNKWIKVNKVKKHIEYEILSDFSKYSKYYEKYYSDYDNQIESIIEKVKNYSTDKSEMVATLYASWNDFLIKKEEISDLKIVKDVRENWNDTKKRFNEQKWLEVLEEMRQTELKPKGNGNLTIIKGN